MFQYSENQPVKARMDHGKSPNPIRPVDHAPRISGCVGDFPVSARLGPPHSGPVDPGWTLEAARLALLQVSSSSASLSLCLWGPDPSRITVRPPLTSEAPRLALARAGRRMDGSGKARHSIAVSIPRLLFSLQSNQQI